jgi:hypothetical protein
MQVWVKGKKIGISWILLFYSMTRAFSNGSNRFAAPPCSIRLIFQNIIKKKEAVSKV